MPSRFLNFFAMKIHPTICLRAACSLLFLALFGLPFGFGQSLPSKKESLFERLTREESAKITLETDVTTLLENRKTNSYFPATLTTEDGVVRKLEIKPRGKFRRKKCEFPPLKLKFSKKSLVAEGLDTLNEIKLAVPCFDNDEGDELLLKEYLIYRMYEKLTPISLRARLVKITLKDTHVEKSKSTFYAMLIEDEEEVAARLGTVEVEQYGIEPDSLQANQAALTVMFEYMIGNTDWEITMMRNVRLLRSKQGGKVMTVPYDFDFSGFVSAPYASPSSESGLKTVRDRFLMSSGLRTESLKRAMQNLKSHKKELYDVCHHKLLSRQTQAEILEYLETFFAQAEASPELPTTQKVPLPTD